MTEIRLTPDIEEYVNTQVERGAAVSAEDYVNDVLRAQREEDQAAHDELWEEIEAGIADIEAGRYTSVEEAFDIVRKELGLTKPAAE